MIEWLIGKAIGKVVGFIIKYTLLFPFKGICLLGNLIRRGIDTKRFLHRGLARAVAENYSLTKSPHDINQKASLQIALPILGLCLFAAIILVLLPVKAAAWILGGIVTLMIVGFFNHTVK